MWVLPVSSTLATKAGEKPDLERQFARALLGEEDEGLVEDLRIVVRRLVRDWESPGHLDGPYAQIVCVVVTAGGAAFTLARHHACVVHSRSARRLSFILIHLALQPLV